MESSFNFVNAKLSFGEINHTNMKESRFRLDIMKIFYNEGVKHQAAQRCGGFPILGNTQGQVRRGPEQPDLVENIPAHYSRAGIDNL